MPQAPTQAPPATGQVTSQAPDDCAILQKAFPNFFDGKSDCCTSNLNLCEGGRLVELWFTSASLNGPIPPTLAGLTKLRKMSLAGNNLNGPIPDMFDKLPELQTLDLSVNQFTGAIPKSLLVHKTIKSIGLAYNTLDPKTLGTDAGIFPSNPNFAIANSGLTISTAWINTCTEVVMDNMIGYQCSNATNPMADGTTAYADPPLGNSNDPWVTWFDAGNVWHTQQIGHPMNLLNGKKIVTAISNNNICGGHWGILYYVDPVNLTAMPACTASVGAFNTPTMDASGNVVSAQVGASGLQYGQCPKTITHKYQDKPDSGWFTETYNSCWSSQYQKANFNDGGFDGGVYTFASSGMTVAYCCYSP